LRNAPFLLVAPQPTTGSLYKWSMTRSNG